MASESPPDLQVIINPLYARVHQKFRLRELRRKSASFSSPDLPRSPMSKSPTVLSRSLSIESPARSLSVESSGGEAGPFKEGWLVKQGLCVVDFVFMSPHVFQPPMLGQDLSTLRIGSGGLFFEACSCFTTRGKMYA
jgi:hypothetical protein